MNAELLILAIAVMGLILYFSLEEDFRKDDACHGCGLSIYRNIDKGGSNCPECGWYLCAECTPGTPENHDCTPPPELTDAEAEAAIEEYRERWKQVL